MSVTDSVDKYRHGVLIGNFVEDKFGKDLAERGPLPGPQKMSTTRDHHDIGHSLYQPHQTISRKDPATNTFQQTAKNVPQSLYQRPQSETSYHIFHRQQVSPHIPVLNNEPKKQERQQNQGQLYNDTRYNLANKFGSSRDVTARQNQIENQSIRENLRETGNVYNVQGQEIPDILTGEIYKHAYKRPDSEVKQSGKHTGQPTTKITSTPFVKSVNPYSTQTLIKPEIAKFDEEMYRRYVLPNGKGEERDVLFGHGLQINQFQRRQMGTTYDLSYNQLIPPQTQVNSFYNVDPGQSAKRFNRERLYQKNHQGQIPEYGTKTLLGQQKLGRPYETFTKTFDANHLKNEYLRK